LKSKEPLVVSKSAEPSSKIQEKPKEEKDLKTATDKQKPVAKSKIQRAKMSSLGRFLGSNQDVFY
jgi:hypothetical protein